MRQRIQKYFQLLLCHLACLASVMLPGSIAANIGDPLACLANPNPLPTCTELFVDISTACLVPCTSSDYYVRYCNFGDEVATDAFVVVEFDTSFTVNGASIPIANQSGNVLTFNLGNVAPNDCGSFSIHINLDCDAVQGQAHCVDAQIFPAGTCTPPPTNWDGSNVQVEIECQGDSIYFTLENVGAGDMNQSSQFIIIEDDVIVMLNGYYLPSGGDTTIVLPNNGHFYHFEAGQTEGNPNGFFASANIEGCNSISTGFLTQYPEDDNLLSYEETCMVNDDTCNLNNKLAFPLGFDTSHTINANQPIQYQVNFQNTSSDTATTVTVCDTLSSFLDPATLLGGASTFDYTVDFIAPNIVKFIFEGINLPPGGFGFVKFQVDQVPDNPACSRIENWARIYFDQDSVLTDTVFHTIPCGTIIVDTTIVFCGGGGYYAGTFYNQNAFVSNTTSFSTFTSVLNTTILVFPGTPDETITASICEGQTYELDGQSFNTSGTYTIPMSDANGCPYNLILILTVLENEEEIIFASICDGESYDFFGEELTGAGIYSHATQEAPCFSIVVLVLTIHVNNFDTDPLELSICEGDTLAWEGELLTVDTFLTHTYSNQHGCDSLSKLLLTVYPNYDINLDAAICEGDVFFIGPNGFSTPGVYSDTLLSIHNCDSIVTVNLSILPLSHAELAAVICEGGEYQVGSQTYTTSGTYITVLPAANGCDSTVTLELIVQECDPLCFANAGVDTVTCGFDWVLTGMPSSGTWEVICAVSPGLVELETLNDSTSQATVNECGIYYFKYTHTRFDTLVVFDSMLMVFDTVVDTCMASDIVRVDFEDPSSREMTVSGDLGLVYNDYTCPDGDGVTCSNVFFFDETAPMPMWKFDIASGCVSNIYSTTTDSVISDCLVSDVTVHVDTYQGGYNPPVWCVGQAEFIELDSNGQVVSDSFVHVVDSLLDDGLGNIINNCPAPPPCCFSPDSICLVRDTLGLDTGFIAVPVHLGGHWTYIDQTGANIPLQDSTDLVIANMAYRFIVTPNAHTYSPVQFEIWKLLANDSLVQPGAPVSITLQWKELWTYDTVEVIRPILSPLPDSCFRICGNNNTLDLNGFDMPPIPEFDCPPFTLTFEGMPIHIAEAIVCNPDLTYTITLTISGGTPPYMLTGLAGTFLNDSVFVSDPLPWNLGYFATVTDSAGCTGEISREGCRCKRYFAQAPPTEEINCIDPCLVLTGTVVGSGNQWSAEWRNIQGDILSTDIAITVCEPGIYLFIVTDLETGCKDTTATQVVINLPVAEAGPGQTLTCNQDMATLLGDELTGDSPIFFSWVGPGINSGNQHQQTPVVSAPGLYFLTVANPETGCFDTDSVFVELDISLPNAVIASPTMLTCINPTASLNSNNSTPLGQISFYWYTMNGNIVSGENTPFPVVDQPGNYILEVTNNSNGCTDLAQVFVTGDIAPPQQVNAGTDEQVDCNGATQVLQGSVEGAGNYSYNWTTINGNIVSGENTLMPLVDAGGIYTLTVSNPNNGCSASDTTEVVADFNYPAALIAEPDTLDCLETSLPINGLASTNGPDIIYNWTTQHGHLVEGINTAQPTVDEPGVYYFTVLDTGNGCATMDTTEIVEDIDLPEAQAGQDGYFSCQTDSLKLNGSQSQAGTNISYHWIALSGSLGTGGDSQTPWVNEPGSFMLVVTDENNGCETSDTVIIEAYEPVSFELVTTPDCQGSDVGSVSVVNLQGQANSYFFELDNGQVRYDSLFTALPAGNYTLTVLDQDSCAVIADFSLEEVPPLPALNFEEAYHFCGEEEPLTLDATVGIDSQWVSYAWSTGEETAFITTIEEGTYAVTISTSCETAIYEFEIIDDLKRASFFEMPNAFSPNDDGINDKFGPVTFHEMEDFEIIIFDRWGEKIYHSDDINSPWDGTNKGKQVQSDVYIYKVVATYMDCIGTPHRFSLKGDVTVLR